MRTGGAIGAKKACAAVLDYAFKTYYSRFQAVARTRIMRLRNTFRINNCVVLSVCFVLVTRIRNDFTFTSPELRNILAVEIPSWRYFELVHAIIKVDFFGNADSYELLLDFSQI